jgi:Cft2 family RNA processing exonuclease
MDLECLPYRVGHQDGEGICILVKMGTRRILLDCGLNDLSPLLAADKHPPADVVLCSHAHSDHAQGLLALHQAFPQLPVYTSDVTGHLLPLNWPDYPWYEVPKFWQTLPWRKSIELYRDLTVEMFPAGHLPGAAAFLLTYTGYMETETRPLTLFYTGDFLLSNSRMVQGLPLEDLRRLQPDVLVVEGSYGTSRFSHRRSQENQLLERIAHAISMGQSVCLPVPALGLGQELLMLLRSHHLFSGRPLDIWVQGSVALGCDLYLEILQHLPASVQNFAYHQPLFWDERIYPRVRRLTSEQYGRLGEKPCVAIADSTFDLEAYRHPDSGPWLVLRSQNPGYGETITPNAPFVNTEHATFETYLLSEHCDVTGTTQLIHNLRPQHVIFIHGAPTYLADLTNLPELRNRYHLHAPDAGNVVELPVSETFHETSRVSETTYQGELMATDEGVVVTLPSMLQEDPRWQELADTGFIEARWQGEELVMRGISQRELMSQEQTHAIPDQQEACGTCRHFRQQRCWNPASPLFELKVPADGYCPAYEPLSDDS